MIGLGCPADSQPPGPSAVVAARAAHPSSVCGRPQKLTPLSVLCASPAHTACVVPCPALSCRTCPLPSCGALEGSWESSWRSWAARQRGRRARVARGGPGGQAGRHAGTDTQTVVRQRSCGAHSPSHSAPLRIPDITNQSRCSSCRTPAWRLDLALSGRPTSSRRCVWGAGSCGAAMCVLLEAYWSHAERASGQHQACLALASLLALAPEHLPSCSRCCVLTPIQPNARTPLSPLGQAQCVDLHPPDACHPSCLPPLSPPRSPGARRQPRSSAGAGAAQEHAGCQVLQPHV